MSSLSGYETHEGLSVRVEIFQIAGTDHWWLEVIDTNGRLTRWDAPFASEKDAYLEFCATVVIEGMREFTQ
ncbi:MULTISPECIES: hypothetical protein [Rhizobium/Agrobacterium group]|uniref:hypothetical protein n=1 Tax=Rhizobium/Agrobacterium group TaxID=227290 RepID=UPI0010525945|nr:MULTISPECIES: hypothetical protein [Rhizobium/Agrobacterium group]TCR71477.1 hypothetical protein EV561_13347 [Rhizobium sp. BK376]